MAPRLVGYARVSTVEQTYEMQVDALVAHGVPREMIFSDIESGRTPTIKRPGLMDALKACREGGTLWVWKLDRLGRNAVEIIVTVHRLHERGVSFGSITQPELNTVSMQKASGRFVFHLFAALAQLESDQLSERTMAGMAVARKHGKQMGRKTFHQLYVETGKVEEFQALRRQGVMPMVACDRLRIKRSTYRKWQLVFEPVVAVDDIGAEGGDMIDTLDA